jgi:hypothetical protein
VSPLAFSTLSDAIGLFSPSPRTCSNDRRCTFPRHSASRASRCCTP